MIAIEFIIIATTTAYFLPFWWGPGTATIWAPGLTLSAVTLFCMCKKLPAARFWGATLLIVLSYLPLYLGAEGLGTLAGQVRISEQPTLCALAALPAALGIVVLNLGFRLLFGQREKEYFRNRQRLE